MSEPKPLQTIQQKLLAHYRRTRRDLPWRRTADPYAIWVSEVMLQQTQVATVTPYFERFLQRFPTLEALAAAPLQEVLHAWEGLGYYRRARNLHLAAQKAVAVGGIPDTADRLRELPGIGRYTAGAIASIAFGRPEPVVDGNVQRVLSRIFELRGDVSTGKAHEAVWQTAKALLPPEAPGDFNQALMELGATICLPNDPRCPQCPVQADCAANRKGLQETLPELPPGKASVKVTHVCAVVRHAGRVLLIKRLPGGLWADMWEFPRVVATGGENIETAAARAAAQVAGVRVKAERRLKPVKHQVTYHAITLHAVICEAETEEAHRLECADFQWVDPKGLSDFPMPAPQRKIAEDLDKPEIQKTLF